MALLDWEDRAQAASEQIRAVGGICEFFRVDVSSEFQVVDALNRVAERFQGVDHLVNNAGMVVVKGIGECTAEEWDRVMNVNLKSIFLTVKYALPWVRRSPQLSVVNTGSVSSSLASSTRRRLWHPRAACRCCRKRWHLTWLRIVFASTVCAPGLPTRLCSAST